MQLIIFILAFMVLGYVLARTDNRREEQPSQAVPELSSKKPGRLSLWWQERFTWRKQASRFRAWVAGANSADFSEDFQAWLAQLSPDEAAGFTHALAEYARGLGFDLDQAMNGDLDKDPRLKSVFVEAIVVYSQAYRKAKQVNKDAEKKAPEAARQEESTDGKQPAEKKASRRKSDPLPLMEAAPAG
jgi:hypothetical protein